MLLFLAWSLSAGPGPLIIAHRGASGYLPEHTLEAKALAHAQGADFLEQDLVLSKDGVPVVLHDIHIDTVTDVASRHADRKRADGRFYALDFTVAELKQLKVTERFDHKTGQPVFKGRFPPGQGAFAIATFEEELQFIEGLNRTTGRRTGIYPEIKAPAWHREHGRDLSPIVLRILAEHGYRTKADPCFLQCFDYSEVKRLRGELGWSGRLVQLLAEKSSSEPGTDFGFLVTKAGLEELARVADGIGPALSLVARPKPGGGWEPTELVRDAHALKLVVHPYTVRADALPKGIRAVEELLRLLLVEAGADGVFIDQPDRGAAFLAAMKGG